MKKTCTIIFPVLLIFTASTAQDTSHYSNTSSISKTRPLIVSAASAAIWASSFIALNQAWYADYPRSSFHFFNDNKEWQMVDKAGHIWSAYQVSRIWTEMWKWTGINKNHAVIAGGASGLAYVSIIEIQDGFSSEWGFSWADMLANVAGSAAFVTQELTWKDQRLLVKMGYSPFDYGNELRERRNQLFGNSVAERILKDYNSHTYWVSMNLRSFTGAKIPAWLNVAAGYHAEGMLGGFQNSWTDSDGNYHKREDIQRTRSFLIAPDIDFTKIKTRSKGVRSLLFVLNMVKLPAPALQISKGKVKGHWMYF